jgi:hypothetical protein
MPEEARVRPLAREQMQAADVDMEEGPGASASTPPVPAAAMPAAEVQASPDAALAIVTPHELADEAAPHVGAPAASSAAPLQPADKLPLKGTGNVDVDRAQAPPQQAELAPAGAAQDEQMLSDSDEDIDIDSLLQADPAVLAQLPPSVQAAVEDRRAAAGTDASGELCARADTNTVLGTGPLLSSSSRLPSGSAPLPAMSAKQANGTAAEAAELARKAGATIKESDAAFKSSLAAAQQQQNGVLSARTALTVHFCCPGSAESVGLARGVELTKLLVLRPQHQVSRDTGV